MLSGRRAQAARNDRLILEAARAVFAADPDAPIAAVANHAHVGISALYRRFRSKEDLLQRLAADSLDSYVADVEAALADDGDPWSAFCNFMQRTVAAGTGLLVLRAAAAGRTPPAARALALTQQVLERAEAGRALRPEIEVADVGLLLQALHAVQLEDPARTAQVRMRYLALMLDALNFLSLHALPGPAPTLEEIAKRAPRRADERPSRGEERV
jgi:AcrR family transcriptional regulator